MLIVVYFLVSGSLILEGVEVSVPMHAYGRLLPVPLEKPSQPIKKVGGHLSHLLHLKFVFLILVILDPFVRGLPYRHILGGTHV